MKTGVLLLNVGSPEAPTSAALRIYLRQFLSNPRVLDIPAVSRWLLLHAIILRFRPRKSAHAYAQIWTAEGSPLLAHTRAFSAKLAKFLGDDYRVEFAMGVGKPSIPDSLEGLLREPLRELVIFPMFPQYASATTGACIEDVLHALSPALNIPPLRTLGAFFNHPAYLNAVVQTSAPLLASLKPDHVLFSYHGLPEQQVQKSETKPGYCLASSDSCCAEYGPNNAFCYRAQCFATTRLLAEGLGLAPESFSQSFQSRLGRAAWIRPYTDKVLVDLARRGVRRLAVLTPSFVADCLETLEEIGIRGAKIFHAAGGERLDLIPAPNASEAWVQAAAAILKNKA
jgi:ferrochelatase